ncbi:hypothetical protein CC_2846 [Caulobacter vibrioides CB15]|uniref:Uncharacterized protein n=1 Tax=Caulobacter vibrioides (strain ATCC 19089 / CIP 103742 / CB 15) TaxID=190650 RepID=Q9A4I5_CAUVC|nr:hypothetical protein CC_2846 [Caulobacter vibrioides CB15]ATC29679.1 hypothetical protein CA607_15345 [Caulobacter vibrioides]
MATHNIHMDCAVNPSVRWRSRPVSTQVPRTRRFAAVVGPIAFSTLGIVLSLFAAVAVDAQPRTPGRVAAVFPPWWDDARVVASAGTAGDIAGAGGASFIVILRGDPATLNQRARTAGAWLLLDPALAGACARPASEPVSS